ncbi:DUF262 domain-containing protein [Stigmatella hybrida]|uniref:DUF262 domain-containing protein n=1 Tax=Stigmatella hybrida TaxID=394097 RepID=UPI001CDABD86|nr:DUF262 domain-containing protein [Stigmatella hybrida]
MSTTLSAHEKPISKIFSNDYVFSIPGYQRPYAWTEDQARDLLDDLTGFMKAFPGDVEDMPPYFLGSIVLIKKENIPNADVVDGQQRLTTLTLLLSAIRANVDPKNAADINQLIYEQGSAILGTHNRFRLSLRERDKSFFREYVQLENGFQKLLALGDVLTDSQNKLQANAKFFQVRLGAMAEMDRLKLAQFIVTRCFLVAVSTPDIDSAYRIFSVLNSRGMDLSATDILKAEFIGAIPERDREHYTKRWETAEEDLGRDAFGDLFGHIRMVFLKAKPKGTLLKEFKEHVSKEQLPSKLIDDVILPMAEVYEELLDSAYTQVGETAAVNECLKWLNRLEFNDWMPPALAFAVRHRGNPNSMRTFFADLERLAYMMLLTRAGVNERIERFSRLTSEVEDGVDLGAVGSALQLTSVEQLDALEVLEGPVYETLSPRSRASILLRLDALLADVGAKYDYNTVTVEHVLPQNPRPDSKWMTWFSSNEHAVRVHKLGNLALLTRKKNSAASNYEFERKKEKYFTVEGVTPFVLTTQVIGCSEWTPNVVDERQKTFVSKLSNHWRLGNSGEL